MYVVYGPYVRAQVPSGTWSGKGVSFSATDRAEIERQLLHRSVQRFRGGLVFEAHRLCVPLNSRRESNKEQEEERERECVCASTADACDRTTVPAFKLRVKKSGFDAAGPLQATPSSG